jgi:serine/threonine-protein kinase
VTGRTLNEAESRLRDEGFKVATKDVNNDAPPGTVTEQSPIPGDVQESCSFLNVLCSKPKVTLTYSKGPGEGRVPSTAGQPLAKATAELEDADFQVQVDRVNSASVADGLVIHSEPAGGTSLTHGSTVVLTVSSGPKLAKVPVLVGYPVATAEQQIRAAGLEPNVSEEPDAAPAGQVIRQTPSAGSRVDPGSAVTIVVSEGEETAKVPNVIGKLRPDAVTALREAGLDPTVSEQQTDVPSKVGKVTDQFPPPGAEVEPGASVTIVVGKAPPANLAPEEEE